MDKQLIDKAWRCLPREFREEVKKIYKTQYLRVERIALLCNLFGAHNLTSDAEGDEMLTVSRKEVQERYAANERLKDAFPKSEIYLASNAINVMLQDLFGSKCLPDKPPLKITAAEDCIAMAKEEMGIKDEPKPAEPNENFLRVEGDLNTSASTCTDTCTDYCQSLCKSQRLQIAAMAMQGILSNADRMKQYGEIAMRESENLTQLVARNAMRYADALIAEAEKGGAQ